jgi:hypothetical protein
MVSWLTRSFNFIDKDPEVDVMRSLYQKQRIREADLAVLAGLAVSTVKNMFGGKTRRPQHLTCCKLAGAMGKEYGLRDIRTPDYAKEIPVAKEEFKAHKEKLKRARDRATKKNGRGK